MNVAILAVGSLGDVVPYAALGKGLKARGHDVTLATYECFEPLIRGCGLRLAPLPGDPRGMMASDVVESGQNPFKSWRRIFREFSLISEELTSHCLLACAGADVVLCTPLALVGHEIGKSLGIPTFRVSVAPISPTCKYPMVFFPTLPGGLPFRGLYNRLTYYLDLQIFWWHCRRAMRRASLTSIPSLWSTLRMIGEDRSWLLYGFSPTVIPPPRDWGDWTCVTGFWFLDPPEDWRPSAALQAFLENGPAPVYVGFGSMVGERAEQTTSLILDALKRTGQRGVLATGWGGLMPDQEFTEDVFVIDSVPHGWLFPRMAALVHHGGGGTTAMGLRSGVPSVLVPFMADQYFWGDCVARLGVGPRPLPRKRLTASVLARRIEETLSSSPMRERAAQLGTRLRSEDGVALAVEALESRMRKFHSR